MPSNRDRSQREAYSRLVSAAPNRSRLPMSRGRVALLIAVVAALIGTWTWAGMNVWVKRAGERLALVNWPGSQGLNHTGQPFEIRMVSSTFELLDSWRDSGCDEWIKSYEDPSVPFSYIQPPRKPYCYVIEIAAMPIRIISFILRLALQILLALIYVALRILSFFAAFLLHCWSVALKGIWHTIIEFIANISFPILLFWYVVTQWKLLLLVVVTVVFVIYTPSDFAG